MPFFCLFTIEIIDKIYKWPASARRQREKMCLPLKCSNASRVDFLERRSVVNYYHRGGSNNELSIAACEEKQRKVTENNENNFY